MNNNNKLDVIIYKACLFIVIIFFHFFTAINTSAEGTKEIMPYDNHESRILIYPSFNSFASQGAGPDNRLHIHIENIGEKIYYGFGNIFDGSQNLVTDLTYSLIDPAGNTVINPTPIPSLGSFGYINSYQEACNGPLAINPLGYLALSYTPTMVGDYYIEFYFNYNQVNTVMREISLFDVTVTNNADAPFNGRLWSKEWLFIVPLSPAPNYFENPFYAKLFMYSKDSIVTKVDLNGIRPRLFTVASNTTGTSNTGDPLDDRKSKDGDHTYPEYKIFLNDPDSISYPSGEFAAFTSPLNFTGCTGNYNINVQTNSLASVQLLIELNGINGYQVGTEDVLIIQNVTAGPSSISWNGVNGLGQAVISGTIINLYCTMTSGLTHMPLYDVEHNPDGFKIDIVRPITNSTQFNLYWDDSNFPNYINAPSGGCVSTSGCHDFPLMFGDERTINTWWYASSDITDSLQFTFNSMIWDTIISSNPTCANTNDGVLIANILGGTAPFTYHLNNVPNTNGLNFNNLISGNYIFSVTDSNNCILADTIELAQADPIQAILVSLPDYCATDSSTGSINITNQFGNFPFHYLWSTGPNDTLISINELTNGTYTVTITDDNNCSSIYTVEVLLGGSDLQTQDLLIHDTCGNGQGEIQITLYNGIAPITYEWSFDSLLNINNLTNLSAGDYSVTITDTTGCNIIKNYQILDIPPPSSDFLIPTDICVNSPFTIYYDGNQTTPDNFDWDFSGAQILSGQLEGPYSLQFNNPGNYPLSLSANKLGCLSDIITQIISVHKPIINIDSISHVSCFNDIDGYIGISLSDVVSPFTLQWNNIDTNILTNDQLSIGNYQIIVTDTLLCTDTLNIIIQQPDKLIANTSTIDASCPYTFDGILNAFANGGTRPYQYQLNNLALGLDSVFAPLSPGTYQILINDANGCKDTIQSNIGYSQDIIADFNIFSSSNIENAGFTNFTFTGVGAINYLWDFGDNTNDNSQNPSHFYSDLGDQQVVLMVNSGPPHNCWDTIVKIIEIKLPFQIFVPNAFSPNNDGLNDLFTPIGSRIVDYKMNIYNRYGKIIYTTNSIEEGWDGTYKNKKMAMGVYTYIIILETEDGRAFKKAGTLTLLL